MQRRGEQGFGLVAVIVAIFLVLLALSVAAPTVAKGLRREREVEAVHRANQYVRAIQLFYKKTGHYPGSIEQLEKTNNQRFLRQKYLDPMTGKDDWRIINVGEQKTTVKGFFGQPLAGIASPGLGSVAGMSSGIGTGSTVGPSSATGAAGAGAMGASTPSGFSLGSSTSGAGGSTTGTGATTGSSTTGIAGSSTGVSSSSATSFKGGGGQIMGIGSSAGGDSILIVNEQTTHPTWEFIYDPRIEQLKAKVNLLGRGDVEHQRGDFWECEWGELRELVPARDFDHDADKRAEFADDSGFADDSDLTDDPDFSPVIWRGVRWPSAGF